MKDLHCSGPPADFFHARISHTTQLEGTTINKRIPPKISTTICFSFLVMFIAGCASQKETGRSPDTGLSLRYQLPESKPLNYERSSSMNQVIQRMGQEITVTMEMGSFYSLISKGTQQGNLRMGVTIDSMKMRITSPQGEMNPDMKSLRGKNFIMSLSPRGKESDLSGAEAISYTLAPGNERNVGAEFQALFPDFPEQSLKIGDTWPSVDTMRIKSQGGEMTFVSNNLNAFRAFVTVDGMECVTISSTGTGTVEGKGQQGPANLITKGTIQGTDTVYFAYKRGIVIKSVSHATAESVVTVEGAGQDMTIPIKMKTIYKTTLRE